jgi:hypothetical protein
LTEIAADNDLIVACDEEKEYAKVQVEIPEKSSECRYHLGYLSERTQKEQIPDDCMMCKDIVECMLKKMKE